MVKKQTEPTAIDDIPAFDPLAAEPSASLFSSWWALHVPPPGAPEDVERAKPSSAELAPFEHKEKTK